MSQTTVDQNAVFLNIPYDEAFTHLYVAYIVGLVDHGLTPRAALENRTGEARLLYIFELIKSCRHSIHDLSRTEVDPNNPIPRFNMPFELGLSVAWAKMGIPAASPSEHSFYAFESQSYRGQRTTSDMAPFDFRNHGGKPEGVFAELCNIFTRKDRDPEVPTMIRHYEIVMGWLPEIKRKTGNASLFQARPFNEIVLLAVKVRDDDRIHITNP